MSQHCLDRSPVPFSFRSSLAPPQDTEVLTGHSVVSRSEGVKGLRDSAGKNHVGKEDAIEVEGTVRESLPNTARQENDPGGNRTIDLDVLLAGCADDSFDDGIRIDTALVIDNVPSQANRLEEALRLDRHAPAVDLRLTAPPKVPELTPRRPAGRCWPSSARSGRT